MEIKDSVSVDHREEVKEYEAGTCSVGLSDVLIHVIVV